MQIQRNAAILAMAFLTLTASALANNIVVNGNFEGSTYIGPNSDIVPTGWVVGPPYDSAQSKLNVDSAVDLSIELGPEAGTYYARYQSPATGGKDCLYQDLSTVAGMTYDVSFWVAFTSTSVGNNVSFDAIWDEQGGNYASMVPALDTPSNTGPVAYVFYTFEEVASGTTTRIDFHAVDTNGSVLLDNVTVSQVAPEPATWMFAGTGMLVLGAIRRRKR